jgi:hypothetical protein
MVNVIRDHTERTYGYQIMESDDGVQRMIAEGAKFSDPGEVMRFTTRLGAAITNNKVAYLRDREATNTYGFQIYEDSIPGQPPLILDEQYGWLDSDEVKQHINSLRKAIAEGIKTFL